MYFPFIVTLPFGDLVQTDVYANMLLVYVGPTACFQLSIGLYVEISNIFLSMSVKINF